MRSASRIDTLHEHCCYLVFQGAFEFIKRKITGALKILLSFRTLSPRFAWELALRRTQHVNNTWFLLFGQHFTFF